MFICFAARRAIQFSSRTIDLPRSRRFGICATSSLLSALVRQKCPCRAQHAPLRFFFLFVRQSGKRLSLDSSERINDEMKGCPCQERIRNFHLREAGESFRDEIPLDIFITRCRFYVRFASMCNSFGFEHQFRSPDRHLTLIVRSSHIRPQSCFRIF